MDDVERLLKESVAELDKLLNAKNVLGDPIERDGATIIPLVSYGFGFGAGGDSKGAGTGAGGGIKPVGAIVIDANGARVEGVKGPTSAVAKAISETAARVMDKGRSEETPSAKGD